MIQIRIQNFGPITDSGWLEIKKNTFFIGNQGSGKSTIAKLISLMLWYEKAFNRGDFNQLGFIEMIEKKTHFKYHSIKGYFQKNTKIEFIGEKCQIIIFPKGANISIKEDDSKHYRVPKIMYVPSERNLIASLKNAFKITNLPENLSDFNEEIRKTELEIKDKKIQLGLPNYSYLYDSDKDSSFIIGNNHNIDITEASSGLQSYTPLFLVSKKLSHQIENTDINDNTDLSVYHRNRMEQEINDLQLKNKFNFSERRVEELKIKEKYHSKSFINIVEEPEQNLFPDSQWNILLDLERFNNSTDENRLIITTHSPYIINYLALLIKGHQLHTMELNNNLKNELEKIIPFSSAIKSDDIIVYELNESTGIAEKLDDYKGLPSDENFLNSKIEIVNDIFDKLLDIEERCQ